MYCCLVLRVFACVALVPKADLARLARHFLYLSVKLPYLRPLLFVGRCNYHAQ